VALPPSSTRGAASRDRWIPWAFVGGMLTVVAVNAGLIYFAMDSWTGLAVQKPYERGVAYNQVLAAASAQEALGWRLDVMPRQTDGETEMVIAAQDRAGTPLDGLRIVARVSRPLEPAAPLSITLQPVAHGRYAAGLGQHLRAGQWEVRVTASRGEDISRTVHRVVLP
jgi:nitrogen fixation protein FixH